MIKFDIAVIGAGLTGLIAAERLRRAGRQVLVVDKARGPGGRLATRRGDDSVRMDHGCQYLVEDVRDELATLVQDPDPEFMASWGPVHSRGTSMEADHYPIGSMWHVGMPTMSAIPKSLAAELEIRLRTRVTRLNRVEDDWQLLDDQGGTVASARWVVCAIPSPQAVDLLGSHGFSGLAPMSRATYDPNWTLMVVEPGTTTGDPDVIKPERGPISWIVNQRSKPGRPAVNAWVAQATVRWSIDHLELDRDEVIRRLLPALAESLDRDVDGQISAHRWRYAFVNKPTGIPALIDEKNRMAACGDWCLGDKASHAIRSGHAAAEGILQAIQ